MAHGLSPYGTALATPAISKLASITLAHGWSKPGDTNTVRGRGLVTNVTYKINVKLSTSSTLVVVSSALSTKTGTLLKSFVVPATLTKGLYKVVLTRATSTAVVRHARLATYASVLAGTVDTLHSSDTSSSTSPSATLAVGFDSVPPETAYAGTPGTITLSPSVIDTSTGPVTVIITAEVTDDLSGVSAVQMQLRTALTYLSGGAGMHAGILSTQLELVSGTNLDGIWQGSFVLPMGSGGQWTVNEGQIIDGAHNWANPYTVASAVSYATSPVTVTNDDPNSGGVSVPGFGEPNALNFVQSSFDTTSSAQTIDVTLGISDPSGLQQTGMSLCPVADTTPNRPGCSSAQGNLISGTFFDGVYQYSFVLPPGSHPGEWDVMRVTWQDAALDGEFYNPAFYGSGTDGIFGLPAAATEINNTSTVFSPHYGIVLTPATEASTPVSISPSTVDTSSQAQTVTLTIPVTVLDAGSTINYVSGELCTSVQCSSLVSFSANSPVISNGTIQISITLPMNAAAGTWTVEGLIWSVNDPVTGGSIGVGYYNPDGPLWVTDYLFSLVPFGYDPSVWNITNGAG